MLSLNKNSGSPEIEIREQQNIGNYVSKSIETSDTNRSNYYFNKIQLLATHLYLQVKVVKLQIDSARFLQRRF